MQSDKHKEALEALERQIDRTGFPFEGTICGADGLVIFDKETTDVIKEALQSASWQPIETAPRDGTVVLCCVYGATPSTAMFLETPMGRSGWSVEYMEAHEDEEAFEQYMEDHVYNPTHWMPLPAAPVDGGEK